MQTLTYMYFYVELVYARQARKESQNETLARSDSFDRRRYACEASEESEGSSDGVSDDSINFGARAREWRVDADGGADGGSHASEPASAKQSGDDFFSVSCRDAIAAHSAGGGADCAGAEGRSQSDGALDGDSVLDLGATCADVDASLPQAPQGADVEPPTPPPVHTPPPSPPQPESGFSPLYFADDDDFRNWSHGPANRVVIERGVRKWLLNPFPQHVKASDCVEVGWEKLQAVLVSDLEIFDSPYFRDVYGVDGFVSLLRHFCIIYGNDFFPARDRPAAPMKAMACMLVDHLDNDFDDMNDDERQLLRTNTHAKDEWLCLTMEYYIEHLEDEVSDRILGFVDIWAHLISDSVRSCFRWTVDVALALMTFQELCARTKQYKMVRAERNTIPGVALSCSFPNKRYPPNSPTLPAHRKAPL